MSVDSIIMRLAAGQHGVVARTQLLEAGVAPHRIDYRVRSGRIARIHRGVYQVGPVRGRYHREAAAVLAAGPGAAVTGRSAASMRGLLGYPREGRERARPRGRTANAPVILTSVRDIRIADPGLRVYRTASLPDDEVVRIEAVPVTTVGRTLLDLAADVSPRTLERVVARALREGLLGVGELEAIIERHANGRGAGALHALLRAGHKPTFTRSEAERRFSALGRGAGLSLPSANAVIEGFEVDFVWKKERLVVEVDGRAHHSGDGPFEGDRARDGTMIAAGYAVMRVTWRQIVDEPTVVVARVAQALARRER